MSPTGRPATASRSSRSPAGHATTGPTRRYAGTSHIDVANLSPAQARELAGAIAGKGPDHLRPRLLPQPAPSRPGAPRAGHRPPQARHHGRREDGRAAGQHVHGRRRGQDPGRELAGRAGGLARHRALRPGPRAQADHRELPHDLQPRRVAGRPQHRLVAVASGDGSWSSGAAPSGSTTTPRTWSG